MSSLAVNEQQVCDDLNVQHRSFESVHECCHGDLCVAKIFVAKLGDGCGSRHFKEDGQSLKEKIQTIEHVPEKSRHCSWCKRLSFGLGNGPDGTSAVKEEEKLGVGTGGLEEMHLPLAASYAGRTQVPRAETVSPAPTLQTGRCLAKTC